MVSTKRTWLLASALALVAVIGMLSQGVSAQKLTPAAESCPNCKIVDEQLMPCNATLDIHTWNSKFEYQPTRARAACECNQNFYTQINGCLECQTSDTAKYSAAPLEVYKGLCAGLGQATFPSYPPPVGVTSTSTQPTVPTATTTLPSDENNAGSGSSHSGLSSGAVAGIVVSAIALIVALSVAGYVYTRRKRELTKQKEEEELYKFQENSRNSYMEAPLPQYTGMIQSSLPSLPQLT
ncbi:hypothetical protein BGX23_000312, partial [Mortierella sp. AD031]